MVIISAVFRILWFYKNSFCHWYFFTLKMHYLFVEIWTKVKQEYHRSDTQRFCSEGRKITVFRMSGSKSVSVHSNSCPVPSLLSNNWQFWGRKNHEGDQGGSTEKMTKKKSNPKLGNIFTQEYSDSLNRERGVHWES